MRKRIYLLSVMVMMSLSVLAQMTVTGVVMAQDEPDPVIGANVMIKGTTNGTITDFDGNFSLQAKAGDVLQVSFMGYKSQEVKVTNAGPLRITLVPDNVQLQEVVAIGYGTMKKSDLTGAVTSVSADQLLKAPVAGLDQALQGRAAGVTVTTGSGQPGEAATIRIRGIGSALGGNDPLYVVDGVITSDIKFLAPSDIQSMEILKDASATAIYGSRGANGVILITTKSGSEGKINISFDSYWGFQNRWKKLDLMNSNEMAETMLRMGIMKDKKPGVDAYNTFMTDGITAWMRSRATSKFFPNNTDYTYDRNTDWQDEVFNKNAFMHNYNLSVDGGGEKGHYAFSANYFSQDGTIIGSNYERVTLRLNSDYKIRNWLKFGEHLSFMYAQGRNAMNNSDSPGASVISAALAMAPWDPTHYPEGSTYTNKSTGEVTDLSGRIAASSNFKNVTNPFSMVNESYPQSKDERLVGDVYLELTPVEGLTIRPSFSVDYNLNRYRLFKNSYEYSTYDVNRDNFLQRSMGRSCTMLEETTITYAREIGKHNFSVMVGQTWSEYNYYSLGGSG
ncbi:MAG: SusC/RagA family TonB-linked outer membrane protein [Paludibacteraceae bacterium]|nr:SusC/RagA family TonB-linked outer membrane protein [Paludibacteraceae bacterium]